MLVFIKKCCCNMIFKVVLTLHNRMQPYTSYFIYDQVQLLSNELH